MVKILVTGGNSFTGKHLLPVLKNAGFDAFSLKSYSPEVNQGIDITDAESLLQALLVLSPDYIIHLAGISFAAHPRPLELYKVNLLGTENLLKTAYKAVPGIKKIILASSANIYGSCGSTYISESVCPSPVNHYAASKLAMEHMAKNWMNKLPITIARPFNYTGYGQDEKFLIPKIVAHFVNKSSEIQLGNTNIARDFTDVRVICKYYLKLLTIDDAIGETVNFCSGRLISLQKIIEDMNEITGHAIEVKVNPAFVRSTEIMELRGNPDKLTSLIGQQKHPSMKETLSWMFQQNLRK